MPSVTSRPPRPDDDDDDDAWFASEQPMRRALVAELQRVKRRARTRWPLILLVAAGLTAAVLWRDARKARLHRAKVVLAIGEGAMSGGRTPMPAQELRDYVLSVLLANQVLEPLIHEYDLFPLRHQLGVQYALSELRDLFAVEVFQNYFLYSFDIDAPRSARIAIVVTHSDPDFAWLLANRLARLIVEGEQQRRLALAEQLARDAELALARVRERIVVLEQRRIARGLALTAAEASADQGTAAALRVELAELELQLHREGTAMLNLTQQAGADEMQAAIDRAGLAMTFTVAAERKPFAPGDRTYLRMILGALIFVALLPVVAIYIGAFDRRVHDREDLARLDLPVLGHLPPFPGDRVGSLRARGVRGRRVAS
jgi:hypothetical protein